MEYNKTEGKPVKQKVKFLIFPPKKEDINAYSNTFLMSPGAVNRTTSTLCKSLLF